MLGTAALQLTGAFESVAVSTLTRNLKTQPSDEVDSRSAPEPAASWMVTLESPCPTESPQVRVVCAVAAQFPMNFDTALDELPPQLAARSTNTGRKCQACGSLAFPRCDLPKFEAALRVRTAVRRGSA